MRVLGVDAYTKGRNKGWIGVELDHGTFVAAHIADRLTTLLSAVNDIQAVGIDMPLGLNRSGCGTGVMSESPTVFATRGNVTP
jgi:hypothetical protein